ncbi:MAG: T9SS type A sorting domain-containing protein [Saprospiraceae bacterium]|nr:T9SS type A sorting domain-containing protein [Saprospiraceae bacterium]
MKNTISILPLLFLYLPLQAATLHIGSGQPYPDLMSAVNVAQPGDTLLLHAGVYAGGLTITNLKGTQNQWITIKNAPGASVIFEGGSNAIYFIDPAYLHISGLIFQHQTGNGVNTDDGGTYDTPAHHVIFEQCTFRDIAAGGDNDLLKLSGLDSFEVRNCSFLNGAGGGSGIDMVGCHYGKIISSYFERLGTNAIQCKGGSEYLRIEGNYFQTSGGLATLNIGGNTDLALFRPDTAHFEAARVQVYANIIIGTIAPVVYTGSVEVDVANNTIYMPDLWVLRILQENVDPNRFLPCGNNWFRNNIVYLSVNNIPNPSIGPNTAPQTFTFSNNLWYNKDNPSWIGPNLPVTETNQLLNQDPLLTNPGNNDFSIPANSPAAGNGLYLSGLTLDFQQQPFANPPSIGAVEANTASGLKQPEELPLTVFPNPARHTFQLIFPASQTPVFPMPVQISDLSGRPVYQQTIHQASDMLRIGHLSKGVYIVQAGRFVGKVEVI